METSPRPLSIDTKEFKEFIDTKLRDKRDEIFLKWTILKKDKNLTPQQVEQGKINDLNGLRKINWLLDELESDELDQFKNNGLIVDGKFPVRERQIISRMVFEYIDPLIQQQKKKP